MTRLSDQYDHTELDDFEELLDDKPRDETWELIIGRVVKTMVGARSEHDDIIQNVASGLRDRLRDSSTPCRTLIESFRLRDADLRSSLLPDVIVHCTPLAPGAASLSNPTVPVEVLSNGSIGRDRVVKWRVCQKPPSLQHYVLVERDMALIEVSDRAGEACCKERIIEGLRGTLELPAIGVSIPFAEMYRELPTA